MFLNYLFYVFFFCMFCFLFFVVCVLVLFCLLFLPLCMVVYFLFVYSCTNHCHWVQTQLQLINIISYISYCTEMVDGNLPKLPNLHDSSPPSPILFKFHFNRIIPSTPRFAKLILLLGFPTKALHAFLFSCTVSCSSSILSPNHPVHIMKVLFIQFSQVSI